MFQTGWWRPADDAADGLMNVGPADLDFYTVRWHPHLDLLFHFAPGHAVSPFLGLGGGAFYHIVKDMRAQGDDFGGLYPGGPKLEGYDEDGKLEQLKGLYLSATATGGLEFFPPPTWPSTWAPATTGWAIPTAATISPERPGLFAGNPVTPTTASSKASWA